MSPSVAQITGGDERFEHLGRVALGVAEVVELVAGQLLGEESVPGLVIVEGVDDVVAIAPDTGREAHVRGLEVFAVGIDIPGGVKPETSPALTVFGRGQQPVEQALVGVGPRVG